jgi:putative transposase
MPRLARLDAPGVLHHIIGRGIERRKVFFRDKDREDFVGRLAGLAEKGVWADYAWVLMPNHIKINFDQGQTTFYPRPNQAYQPSMP